MDRFVEFVTLAVIWTVAHAQHSDTWTTSAVHNKSGSAIAGADVGFSLSRFFMALHNESPLSNAKNLFVFPLFDAAFGMNVCYIFVCRWRVIWFRWCWYVADIFRLLLYVASTFMQRADRLRLCYFPIFLLTFSRRVTQTTAQGRRRSTEACSRVKMPHDVTIFDVTTVSYLRLLIYELTVVVQLAPMAKRLSSLPPKQTEISLTTRAMTRLDINIYHHACQK